MPIKPPMSLALDLLVMVAQMWHGKLRTSRTLARLNEVLVGFVHLCLIKEGYRPNETA